MRWRRGRASISYVLLAVTLVTLGLGGASATAAAPAAAADPPGPGGFAPASRSPEERAGFTEAAQLAGEQGTVQLLVGLAVPTRPEGELTPDQLGAQRRAVGAARDVSAASLARAGVVIDYEYHVVPGLLVTADAAGVATLEASPLVASVEPNTPVPAALDQSVPLIGGDKAQALGYDGSGWNVAILDTGVQRDHPFLAGKVVSEACYSANANCPNGQATQIGQGAAAPCTFVPGSCQHGTHVAGIAAGRGTGFSGVAPGAGIVAIQIFTRVTGGLCGKDPAASPCALTMPGDQVKGLERVYELRNTFRIASVNLSIGGFAQTVPCDKGGPLRAKAVANLKATGIAVVAAAGNDGKNGVTDPACYSASVSVGSTTKADTISSFSNNDAAVSLLAPGSSINSSIPGGGFGYKSGTSMATPHVAGAWAVMKQQDPTAGVDAILQRLQTTGKPITDTRFAAPITRPRIELFQALGAPSVAAGQRYSPLVPRRVVDTRTGLGLPAGPLAGGTTASITLPPGLVPASATAVALNVTATDATAPAAVTVFPGGTGPPPTPSLAVEPGFATANLAIVPLGPGQQLQVTHDGLALDVVGDVEGYFGPTGQAWQPAPPTRLVDTRIGLGTVARALGPDETRTMTVPPASLSAGTTVVALNITTTDSTALGFVTASKTGTVRPPTSSLNPAPFHTLPNLVFVEVNPAGQFDLYNAAGSTHLVVDLVGTFGPYGGLTVIPTTPTRVVDTRPGSGTGSPLTTSIVVPTQPAGVPAGATAVLVHLVGTHASAATFLTTYPPVPSPPTSTLNVVPGDTTSNLAIVALSQGSFVLTNQFGSLDVLVDVVGYVP